MQPLLGYCESERAWLVGLITALVRCESPTTDKAAVDACGRELAARAQAMGGRVRMLPREDAGDHVLIEFGTGKQTVLLLGHHDTVWPVGELARQPIRRVEGHLFGPGVYDMKAGLALGLLAVRALQASPEGLPGRIVLLSTSDEETGSASSRAIVEEAARRSAAVLVLEPAAPDGALKTSRKGGGQYHIRVRGVAAHAGVEPEKGASAIHEIARLIGTIVGLNDAASGLALNVGTIRGGTRGNVVAREAEASVDVRVTSLDMAKRVDQTLRGLQASDSRITLEVNGGIDRPPMERTPAVAGLFGQARLVATSFGRILREASTGGGSDGNFTAALGVPTLDGLGAVGGNAHAVGEYVTLGELPWRAALVATLLRRILAGYTH